MLKTERYDWSRLGANGVMERLPVGDLGVDHSYQRRIVSEQNTLAIARAFSWDAFGALVVMRRADGTLWVVDGQQRLSAVRRRGDIDAVPCIVLASRGPEHEAEVFRAINMGRRAVAASDKFRSAVMMGAEPESTICAWLATRGLRVDKGGSDPAEIQFPHVLVALWKRDAVAAMDAICIQAELEPDAAQHNTIFYAIWYLLRCGIDVRAEIQRLRARGGRVAILAEIRALCIETQTNANERICGLGLLRLINKHRRNKLTLRAQEEM